MIKEYFPHNRLQEEQYKRFMRTICVHILSAIMVVIGIVLTPSPYAHASGVFDPSGKFSTIPTNAEVQAALASAAGSNCAPSGTCTHWFVFAGSGYTTLSAGPVYSGAFNNVTCIGGDYNAQHKLSVDSQGRLGLSAAGLDIQPHCWVGGQWKTTRSEKTVLIMQNPTSIFTTDAIYRDNNNCGTSLNSLYLGSNIACNGLLFGTSPTYTATLTINTTSPYLTGQNLAFTTTWGNLGYTVNNIYFYEDIEETNPVRVTSNYAMPEVGGGASWNFNHTFANAATYHPFIVLAGSGCDTVTSTGAITGVGCVSKTTALLSTSSIDVFSLQQQQSNYEALYTSEFSFSKYQDIAVGETIRYVYSLNSNMCATSTVSGRRIFKDYGTNPIARNDSGTILSSASGTGNIVYDRSNQPNSDFAVPHIHVYCSDGSFHDIFLGGSPNIKKATMVSVYAANDIRNWYPDDWLNGGSTSNFRSGTGFLMESDKRKYQRGELVKIHYVFNVDFAVASLELNNGTGGIVDIRSDTGSLTENANHYGQLVYARTGIYQPFILLKASNYNPSNAATFRYIYLGGGDQPNPYNAINVVSEYPVLPPDGPSEFIGVIGNQSGKTLTDINMKGIFGLDAWNPNILGTTGNWFLDQGFSLLKPVIQAFMYISEYAYSKIVQIEPFNTLSSMMAPVEGTKYVTPPTLFLIPITAIIPRTEFTIHYVSETQNPLNTLTVLSADTAEQFGITNATPKLITNILYAIFALAVLGFLMHHLIR